MKDYIYLIVPFVSLIICQIIKFTIESVKYKELQWGRLLNGAGGMPSTHTTFSFSLTTLLGLTIGIKDPLFAVAVIFSFIVSYDAIGVRFESGKQAAAINDLVDEAKRRNKKMIKIEELKEQLGHKPLEVFGGAILGVITSYTFYLLLF
ncbi:MAG: divergent PAP2 family protein [Bacilli bacterium]